MILNFKDKNMSVKRDADLFDEMMGLTTSLLSQLKTALVDGTKEEKKAILKKIKFLRHLMQMRYERVKTKMNISNEDLNLALEYMIATSPEFKKKVIHAKQELDMHKDELSKLVVNKKKSNSMRTKSKWIRS
jgi:hypothetical protein